MRQADLRGYSFFEAAVTEILGLDQPPIRQRLQAVVGLAKADAQITFTFQI